MPIYEFHCAKCGEDSEVLVRSRDWEGTPCPHCGSKKLSKKFSVFASNSGNANGNANASAEPACGMSRSACGCCKAGVPHSH